MNFLNRKLVLSYIIFSFFLFKGTGVYACELSVATFNLWNMINEVEPLVGSQDYVRERHVDILEKFKELRPSIILLQEVLKPDVRLSRRLVAERYWWRDKKNIEQVPYNPLTYNFAEKIADELDYYLDESTIDENDDKFIATLSEYPIEKSDYIILPSHDNETRFATFSRINIPTVSTIDIYNIHLASIIDGEEERESSIPFLKEFITKNSKNRTAILGGDLNDDEHSNVIRALINDLGFSDSFRLYWPCNGRGFCEGGYTYAPRINENTFYYFKFRALDFRFPFHNFEGRWDYVLFKNNEDEIFSDVLGSGLIFDKKNQIEEKDKKIFPSDHFGVMSSFAIREPG